MTRISLMMAATPIAFEMSATAAEKTGTLNLDIQREEALKAFKVESVPNSRQIEKLSSSVLAKPVAQQSEEELQLVASQANRMANLISGILQEYSSYYHENYRYNFIQTKVADPHVAYARLSNKFISIRNLAYFNLGLKMKEKGESLRAYLYFKDAFRLSIFDCVKDADPNSCMRWKAEQEMKSLLSIEDIQSYVSWQ